MLCQEQLEQMKQMEQVQQASEDSKQEDSLEMELSEMMEAESDEGRAQSGGLAFWGRGAEFQLRQISS